MTLVNVGLGDKRNTMTMNTSSQNPGGNSLVKNRENQGTMHLDIYTDSETIEVITLDSYLDENKITADEVKYIWIDTEGFEAQVLLGAKKLLKEKPIPLFIEFNLQFWRESGLFEEMVTVLERIYSHFLKLTEAGKETLHTIDELRTITPIISEGISNIFMIPKGAIKN